MICKIEKKKIIFNACSHLEVNKSNSNLLSWQTFITENHTVEFLEKLKTVMEKFVFNPGNPLNFKDRQHCYIKFYTSFQMLGI